MANYVLLINWTEQGVRTFKETLDRADAFSKLAEQVGARTKDLCWTLGAYDIVATVEAPDDETMTALALGVCSGGNVRTTTLRAFDRDEMARIVGRAP
jgi:uncharacterized protein with GYD domain